MYSLEIEAEIHREFKKLSKRDRVQLGAVNKKISEILLDRFQFKPLRHPLEGLRRVHVGHFVLIYEVVESSKTVRVLKYAHHDEAYR